MPDSDSLEFPCSVVGALDARLAALEQVPPDVHRAR